MPDPFFSGLPVRRKHRERGTALVLFTIMLALVLLPMVGLAIDGGVAYLAHERLIAATDAAALAGARSLNIGLDLASQEASAGQVALSYFNANFPPGYLNSVSASMSSPTFTQTTYHTITVQVQSSAVINLYFMNLIGHPTAALSASATTSRRDVNVVLTLDRSGSMSRVCGIMKTDAENFVSMFVNGRDTVGLITFMGSPTLDFQSTKNFSPGLNNTLATLQCGGNTGSAAAISMAHSQILSVAEPGALNVIVFFTDGVPNGYQAGPATPGAPNGFPLAGGKSCPDLTGVASTAVAGYIADGGGIFDASAQPITSTSTPTLTKCPYGSFAQLAKSYSYIPGVDSSGNSATASGYASVSTAGGLIQFTQANSDAISQNAADDAARQARNDGIVIYTIGLDGDGGVDSTLLERFANDPSSPIYTSSQPTGKYYYTPNAGQLGAAFDSIASEILRISQ